MISTGWDLSELFLCLLLVRATGTEGGKWREQREQFGSVAVAGGSLGVTAAGSHARGARQQFRPGRQGIFRIQDAWHHQQGLIHFLSFSPWDVLD